MKRFWYGLCAAMALVPGPLQSAETQPADSRSFTLVHANIIDGISNAPIMGATVIVVDGRIQAIGRGPAPAGTKVIDLKGNWLLPGFVDAHVHVADMPSARRALLMGVTTLGEAGVNNFVDVGLRELHRRGVTDLPDVVAAGYLLRPHMADEYFADFPEDADLMAGVRGADAVRRVVRRLASRGVDRIKIHSTERAGLVSTFPRVRVFDDAELVAIVDEASKHGLKVIAHAHGDEGAAAAVRAGVHSIEHGTFIGEETLKLMKDKGTWLDPTVSVRLDSTEYPDPILKMRGRSDIPVVNAMLTMARKIGVKIVAGSDTGYTKTTARSVGDEMIALADGGIPAMEAIRMGTSRSAEALGVGNRTGSIREGYEADLVVVSHNPLEDIRFVGDIVMIVSNGRIMRNYFDITPRTGCAGSTGLACAIGTGTLGPTTPAP